MRIDKLKVYDFKNLRDFQIDFNERKLTTVLVGRNGTGKSNILEALILIFRNLDLGIDPPFKYEIEYDLHQDNKQHRSQERVRIDADPNREKKERVNIWINAELMSYARFRRDSEDPATRHLPNFVFGYYSGPSNRMESHFDTHQERFYNDLINGVEKPLRPLFYARQVHSQFVLLAFYRDEDADIQEFLSENLRIEELDSVLFVMRKPPWGSKEGDKRFWNARGTVADFLDKLYKYSLAPLRLDHRVNIGFRQTKNLGHIYLYLKDAESLRQFAREYPSQQEFFKALESTYISELISEVRIRVKVRNIDGSLTYRELSEGEQQLLMVLGLLRFTKEDESLFLLDEPDTHLNPAWSLYYLNFLDDIVGRSENNQIIMSTHDPLVIAGLEREQVQLMQRNEETELVSVNHPEQAPRGLGIAGLLTSDVYGLRSQLDPQTLELLDLKREVASKEELTDDDKTLLEKLNAQLEGVDFTTVIRDPLYREFVDAMSRIEQEEGLQTPVLTIEQKQKQKRLAVNVIRRLQAEGES